MSTKVEDKALVGFDGDLASQNVLKTTVVSTPVQPINTSIPDSAPAPGPSNITRGGSITPGGSISKSELSTMAGSIVSKLDQYLGNSSASRQSRISSDSNASESSLYNATQIAAQGTSNNNEVDEDVALANNLAAISLAAQKISDIYLEPKPKKITPYGHLVTNEHFEPEKHFYPRVLNAQIHPMVGYFFSLGNERIIARYMHLNPLVNENDLRKCLDYVPKHFQWA
ncbi:hypothetical protein BGZ76_007287, partial [Entomortierella beljakovae]